MVISTLKEHKKKLKELIDRIIPGTRIEVREMDSGYVLDVPVEFDPFDTSKVIRRQFVFVNAGRKTPGGRDIYQVFTICSPETKKFYRNALMLNMNLPFGAFAIAEVDVKEDNSSRDLTAMPEGEIPLVRMKKEKHFVLVDTYLISEVDVQEMAASVMTMARAGDRLEKMVVGSDLR